MLHRIGSTRVLLTSAVKSNNASIGRSFSNTTKLLKTVRLQPITIDTNRLPTPPESVVPPMPTPTAAETPHKPTSPSPPKPPIVEHTQYPAERPQITLSVPDTNSVRPKKKYVAAKKGETKKTKLKLVEPVDQTLQIQLEPKDELKNEVGVQLLSRKLHSQIFPGSDHDRASDLAAETSRRHLAHHGLDIKLASELPETSFELPALQGRSIDEHFYNIGVHMAEPWLSLAHDFALMPELPPKPDDFVKQAGWTKYTLDNPPVQVEDLGSESVLCFDVETLPKESHFAIMACAVSPTAWYVWISPWLLGESPIPEHLIPLGDPSRSRVIIGHHVSYDRARILEEYSLQGTRNRFLDTMSLHIAVKGITSGQRPAWLSYRKAKREKRNRNRETAKELDAMIHEPDIDDVRRTELLRLKKDIEVSLSEFLADDHSAEEAGIKRWEDITSTNSLAELAHLYCGKDMNKTTRSDFMTLSREEILEGIDQYLAYCCNDVSTTMAVYNKVLPMFLESCPNPVSAAGVFTMGSSFLPLDQEWENYLKAAEGKYKELDEGVRCRLHSLARTALAMYQDDVDGEKPWEADKWLSQLDWTPKKVGRSRGADEPPPRKVETRPKWYNDITKEKPGPAVVNRTIPFLLGMTWREATGDHHLFFSSKHGWLKGKAISEPQYEPGVTIADGDELEPFRDAFWFVPLGPKTPVRGILSRNRGARWLEEGTVICEQEEMAMRFCTSTAAESDWEALKAIASNVLKRGPPPDHSDIPISQLDWTPTKFGKPRPQDPVNYTYWPKWYWELTAPQPGAEPGTLDLTVRTRISPLLLRLSWLGHPLFYSRQHGWTFRVPIDKIEETGATTNPLQFLDEADVKLAEMSESNHFSFFKLPHKDGEKANVGSPMSKTFLKYSQDGTLSSPGDDAKSALDMNAQCSYWISARDRVRNQVVIWENQPGVSMGMPPLPAPEDESAPPKKYGMILPQMITMGTVTRRAIENTWLTASNAKPNRVGSELKALVRAPEGYAIVGADVDSEELWIASVMGDAQFGIHGATAIGWMTLEGTKAAGTDLHSKTAAILGINRDQAKVFNYSRIYGAGINHAVLLLLQHSASMKQADAKTRAKELYASTKGTNTYSKTYFDKRFWHGGTESFLFNKLEEIASSDDPRTPALDCGVTSALLKKYLPKNTGEDYMTSRINWVVQSSGVDYLHMLIVSVDYLIKTYDLKARYLISIHDEVRYLAKEEDKYRLALALQIANLWTRSMFAYKLGFDNLPQSVAFFSAVDVDKYLRKEVYMQCVTPSQPIPLPPGESLTIDQIIELTGGGLLHRDGFPSNPPLPQNPVSLSKEYVAPNVKAHRQSSDLFLRAQASTNEDEVRILARNYWILNKSPKGSPFDSDPMESINQPSREEQIAAFRSHAA
ncbi:hypothetical protein BDV93DRAFT_602342 [Ceratobasidium sp. AG-I]|nr:hypothetical protein BDV93DRAFT_602342 [Ceratobasidium sp. AG-I]